MVECKGIAQIAKNLFLGLNGFGAIALGSRLRRLAQNCTEEQMIRICNVSELLGEGAHAIEFASRGRKEILFFRHNLGGGDDLMLHHGELLIKNCRDGRLGPRCRL